MEVGNRSQINPLLQVWLACTLVAEIGWVGFESRQEAIIWRAGASFDVGAEVVVASLAVAARAARDGRLKGDPVTCQFKYTVTCNMW